MCVRYCLLQIAMADNCFCMNWIRSMPNKAVVISYNRPVRLDKIGVTRFIMKNTSIIYKSFYLKLYIFIDTVSQILIWET